MGDESTLMILAAFSTTTYRSSTLNEDLDIYEEFDLNYRGILYLSKDMSLSRRTGNKKLRIHPNHVKNDSQDKRRKRPSVWDKKDARWNAHEGDGEACISAKGDQSR